MTLDDGVLHNDTPHDRAPPNGPPHHGRLRDEAPEFLVSGNTLGVLGTLDAEADQRFAGALGRLLDSAHHELIVDLSAIEYLGTTFFGPLASFMANARRGGRTVVILVKEKVAGLLEVTGLDRLAQVRIVEY